MTTHTGALTTCAYDPVNRLTQAVTGASTETWVYDRDGNPIQAQQNRDRRRALCLQRRGPALLDWGQRRRLHHPTAGATPYSNDVNGNTTTAGATTQGSGPRSVR